MKRAARLAFALGLALAQRAWAGDAFQAVLVGSREVPGPGMEEGSFVAVVLVEGTNVSLTLTPKEVTGLVSAHLHRGVEGVAGKLIAGFPWDSGDGPRRTYVVSVPARVAADLVAHPGNYYVDAHTPRFPGGAARGQLAARANSGAPDRDPPADVREESQAGGVTVPGEPIPGPRVPAGPPLARERPIRSQPAPRARIEKAEQRIVGDVEARTYLDPDFRLAVTATSGLDVVFFASGDCTVAGSIVHVTGAGACALEAHQSGNPYYLAAPIVDLEFPIARADQMIEFAELGSSAYGPYDIALYARASSNLPVAFDASGPCTIVDSSLRILGPGACTVTAVQPGSRNFNPSPSVTHTLEIIIPPPPPP